jgi:hypothetical protein
MRGLFNFLWQIWHEIKTPAPFSDDDRLALDAQCDKTM